MILLLSSGRTVDKQVDKSANKRHNNGCGVTVSFELIQLPYYHQLILSRYRISHTCLSRVKLLTGSSMLGGLMLFVGNNSSIEIA